MSSKLSIKLYLVCGFLGSGKTTFLKKFLSHISHNGEKCGVLMNEFGKIGIDGKTLPKEIDIIELNDGSIFCQCLHREFLEELIKFSNMGSLDVVLIEASGMADPSSLLADLSRLKEKSGTNYSPEAIICLVDAEYFLELNKMILTVQRQIQASNVVIINKTDLVESNIVELIKENIQELNPQASIYFSTYGHISFADTLKVDNKFLKSSIIENKATDIPNPKLSSISLELSTIINRDHFEEFFKEIKTYSYRLKGFIQFLDGWYSINGVKSTITIEKKMDSYSKTGLVLIFRNDVKEEVIKIINNFWPSTK